ncbi:MAG: hypothetical protein J6W10_00465 [Kiritimatiellae bacterium]|nr:hypothetical protein [Kiritimatiellia bacterium]
MTKYAKNPDTGEYERVTINGDEWDFLEEALGSVWCRLGDVEHARDVSKRNPGVISSEDVEEYARLLELSHNVWLAMREIKKTDLETAERLHRKYYNWNRYSEMFD